MPLGCCCNFLVQIFNSTINRSEATRTPLDCALYAAILHDDPSDISEVAVKFAEAGNFSKAIEVAETIEERAGLEFIRGSFRYFRLMGFQVASKSTALAEIAVLQAKTGQRDNALKNLNRALALAEALGEWSGVEQLKLTLQKFVLIGEEERAFSIFTTLTKSDWRIAVRFSQKIDMLAALADSLVTTGNNKRSLETLSQAEREFDTEPPPDIFSSNIEGIANVYARLGNIEKAASLYQTFAEKENEKINPDQSSKNWNLEHFAQKLVELGRKPEGIRVSETITDSYSQARVFTNIAEFLCKSKQYEEAINLLNRIASEELRNQFSTEEEIARAYLDEGKFDKAFDLVHQSKNTNSQALILSHIAKKYSDLGNQTKAREAAISAFEFRGEKLNEKAFIAGAVQYLLLADKNIGMQKIQERGTVRGEGFQLCEIAEKLAEANQDKLAIEVLKFIQAEDYVDDAGPITILDYRASAIVNIALQYHNSNRPVDANLQATLAEFVKLLD